MPNTSTNRLITAVKNLLVANLDDLAAEVDGLPGIVDYLEFEPVLKEADKMPLVWVEWDRSRTNSDPGAGRTLHKYGHDRTVQVGMAYKHTNPLVCARNLRSYADLIRVCLEADMPASKETPSSALVVGVEALWIQWLNTDPSPPFVLSGGVIFRQVVVSFDIPRITRIGED
jgi:hypothetical protein